MDDFASAAMVRLIHLGLARQGLAQPWPAGTAGRSAHVPLAHKRALLVQLLDTHGALALLRLGEAIADAPDEPALLALTLATDPADLVSRWQRLERFVHARHRVQVQEDGSGGLRLRHVSLASQAPPTPAEDLLVLGLLVALAQHIGTTGLQATAGEPPQWHWQAGAWRAVASPSATAPQHHSLGSWHVRWQPLQPEWLPRRPGTDWADSASRLLAADPGRSWTVAAVAHALGSSARTLQRQLAQQGRCFSHLLMDVRLAQSARLLATTPQQTAAIGYTCGFADQAHFSRAFKQHSAMTPVQYRSAFHAGPV